MLSIIMKPAKNGSPKSWSYLARVLAKSKFLNLGGWFFYGHDGLVGCFERLSVEYILSDIPCM